MIWMDVDTALSEVPVNLLPLIDDGDFKSREESVVYNQAGLDLVWNFVTTGGAMTQTAVTPTTAGVHDWANQGNGMYSIEIPDTGGTINNDTEGYGWFVGYATGILPWRGPVIGFRAAGLNDKLIDSAYDTTRGLAGTALPGVAAEGAGGLYTRGSGAGQINQQTAGQVDSNLARWLNVAPLALTSQRVNSNVGAMAANVLTAAAINSSAFSIAKFATDVGTTAYASNPISKAIWERLLSAMVTAGSSGKKLSDIVLQTGDSFARIGVAGVSLTEAGGDGDHLTEAGGTGDHLTAITDEIDDATVSILAGQSAVLTNSGLVLNTTTIATLASQTSFTLTAGSADDDAYNGCILVIRDSVAPTSICFGKVLDYTGSSKTVTLEEDPGIFTFGVGDRACVLAPDAVAAMFDGVVTNAALDTDLDTYQAIVSMSIENGTNHYAVDFAKNGEPIRSGITSPQIQVIKCADGTDLIALDDLTEIDSDGRYKYDESSNIIVAGKMYNLDVTATIGGATRTWGYHMWRDA